MKIYIVLFGIAPFIFSCSLSTHKDANKRLIEGVYTVQVKGEAGIADDTLIVKPVTNQKDIYVIERRVGYQRSTEKGLKPKEWKQEKATAIWNAGTSQLVDQKRGRVYFLSIDGTQMLIGTKTYSKIAYNN